MTNCATFLKTAWGMALVGSVGWLSCRSVCPVWLFGDEFHGFVALSPHSKGDLGVSDSVSVG